jgi:serine/threonine protein kinase
MPVRIEAGSEPIPGYKLIDRIGGGGFGEVWSAEAPGGLLKAIKVVYGDLTTTEPDGTRRAEQELKALKRVQSVRHPYLLSLERYDIIEGRLLIVMELADRNLWDRFRECRTQNLQGLPREELLRYMEETAEVLDLMNAQHQLQHLDIKPQNLFLVHNHAKVADFGLVKDLEGKLATVTGGITPVYAAPETFDGVVSRFCDQYSLAIVYQELLTGQRPFNGNSIQQLIMQHLSAAPNLTPLPKEDRAAIARGLAKNPDTRFPTCMDMVKALRNAGAGVMPAPASGGRTAGSAPGIPQNTIVGARGGPGVRAPAKPDTSRRVSSGSENTPPRGETTTLPPEPVELILDVQELRPIRPAPTEIKGDGSLRPAMVIALGQKGLEVLRGLRDDLRDRFGSLAGLAHLRMLYLETDQEVVQSATQATSASALAPNEVLVARLNRVGHYFRQGSGRSTHESWLNPKILNRIPARNPVTTGLRALGRLAFLDNFKPIVGRIREDLNAITDPEALSKAEKATGLTARTNRPRIYIVAGLGGGTGGGMFIDVAYAVRYLLMQLGYADPDVVGVFLLPVTPQAANRTAALGNAVGALTELNHFSQSETSFVYRPDDRDDRLRDESAPFRQTVLFPLEPEGVAARVGEAARQVGDFLYRDLVTLLGRTVDERRLLLRPRRGPEIACRAVGTYRFSWPRRMLLRRAGRMLCYQLIEAWTNRELSNVQGPVKSRLGEELQRMDLDAEHLMGRLQQVVDHELKRKPESFFQEIIAPLAARGRRTPHIDELFDALSQIEELVGTPNELAKPEARRSGALAEYLDHAAMKVAEEWTPQLLALAMKMIDVPELRLSGAEEAVDQLTTVIDESIDHHEGLATQWGDEAAKDYDRIVNLLRIVKDNPGSRRASSSTPELLELFDSYARGCYRCLQLRQVCALYAHLRGQLTESLQQVDFCRQRLIELSRVFEEIGQAAVSDAPVPGNCLMPTGCSSPEDALRRLLNNLTTTDRKRLDHQVQDILQEKFGGLAQVCLKSANVILDLERPLQQVAEECVTTRLTGTNVVELFWNQHQNETSAVFDIRQAFVGAAPELAKPLGDSQEEVRALGLPTGPRAAQFRSLVQKSLPDAITVTESPDDIIFYREQPVLPLASLDLLGPAGQEAYQQLLNNENLYPHSRTDITDWSKIVPEE